MSQQAFPFFSYPAMKRKNISTPLFVSHEQAGGQGLPVGGTPTGAGLYILI